jgi:hypothetical protein
VVCILVAESSKEESEMPWKSPEEVEAEKQFWAALDALGKFEPDAHRLNEWIEELKVQWPGWPDSWGEEE